ncbi:HTH-type transcriptional activator AmpR [compost metagenome]
MEAALQGVGVALAPPLMFARQLTEQKIRQPFNVAITTGSYWLTRLQSRPETAAMSAFRSWLVDAAQSQTLRDI